MRERDRTPDDLPEFEADEVRGAEEPTRPRDDEPLHDIDPGDEDGLPDGNAPFRVPS